MKEIKKETIKKILEKILPKKKGAKIDDLVEGLHKWLLVNKNKKKVEEIVKDGCPKKKGGGKTRKRKRKRKKRTRNRRGGDGDFFGEIALPIMVACGMYLLFEYFPPNNPYRFVPTVRRNVEEIPQGSIDWTERPTVHSAAHARDRVNE